MTHDIYDTLPKGGCARLLAWGHDDGPLSQVGVSGFHHSGDVWVWQNLSAHGAHMDLMLRLTREQAIALHEALGRMLAHVGPSDAHAALDRACAGGAQA